jgi:hypothetical protein
MTARLRRPGGEPFFSIGVSRAQVDPVATKSHANAGLGAGRRLEGLPRHPRTFAYQVALVFASAS